MQRIIAAALVSLALSACVSAEERLARYQAECRTLGFSDQTEAMGRCVLQLKAIAANQAAARKNAAAIWGSANLPAAYYGVPED